MIKFKNTYLHRKKQIKLIYETLKGWKKYSWDKNINDFPKRLKHIEE